MLKRHNRMAEPQLKLTCIDARSQDVEPALRQLREQLSPRGDVVGGRAAERTRAVFGEPLTPQQVVERICSDVRQRGLDAVLEYTYKLDGVRLDVRSIRVPQERIAAAHRQADPEWLRTVRRVKQNIEQFQRAILHRSVEVRPRPGVVLRHEYRPLERVGICVPGGAAAYPSTVLMTVVPAQVAGVNQIALVMPPTAYGADNPYVLAVCGELGIGEVYRLGGSQAVAALAYGVEGVPKVDKIVGPGNLFVALAKKWVYGDVDIDALAGPSEIVLVADEQAQAEWVAADMLAQAEHAPGAAILVTWCPSLAEAVPMHLARQLDTLERAALTRDSLERYGAIILVRGADQACQVVNMLAPEHVSIDSRDPLPLAQALRCAGAVFVGPYSPVAVGDYAAGPSHVLPTSGTARWASGLSANSFLRSHSIIEYSQDALTEEAQTVQHMAAIEGLTAHRASIQIRFAQR